MHRVTGQNYGTEWGEFMGGCDMHFDLNYRGLRSKELADLKLGIGTHTQYQLLSISPSTECLQNDGRRSTENVFTIISRSGTKVANCILLFGLRDFTAFNEYMDER